MKRLIFGPCRLPNLAMRYYLSNVEFDEPIDIDARQRVNHLVTIKYHLCEIIALLFEYASELVICFFDLVLVQVFLELVFGMVPQVKKRLRSDTEDAKSVNSRFVKRPPIVYYSSAV